nr:Wzy polymerase domain-containing protein [Chromobacterium haemolyticum]
MAVIVLIHSVFEYPLWYLPFLFMLGIVGALAPEGRVFVLNVRPSIVRCMGFFWGVMGVLYCVVGVPVFWVLVRYNLPTSDVKENVVRIEQLSELAKNPLWASSADMVLSNYLLPTKEQLNFKLAYFERLASYQPYPSVLTNLSILRALDDQPDSAKETLYKVVANYPESVPRLVEILSLRTEPEVKPLHEIAMRAAQAYAQHPPHSEAAQLAAVMTVAAPVTRKTLF